VHWFRVADKFLCFEAWQSLCDRACDELLTSSSASRLGKACVTEPATVLLSTDIGAHHGAVGEGTNHFRLPHSILNDQFLLLVRPVEIVV
jgi:hypothetical protein